MAESNLKQCDLYTPPPIYRDGDVSLDILMSSKITVIGYGNQGRAQALNLRDSGLKVEVALRSGSERRNTARRDGQTVVEMIQGIQDSDVIALLVPDQSIEELWQSTVSANLHAGQTLIFAHGSAIHYQKITPPEDVDIVLVAPAGAGQILRDRFIANSGLPTLVAVAQNYSGQALDRALAYSKGIGGTRIGAFLTTFQEETETDLFGEQVLLTGGIPQLIRSAFDTLINAGYQAHIAWLVCFYEVLPIMELLHHGGWTEFAAKISDTAEYGGYSRGKRLVSARLQDTLTGILNEIREGEFEREWQEEWKNKLISLKDYRQKESGELINQVTDFMLGEVMGGKSRNNNEE